MKATGFLAALAALAAMVGLSCGDPSRPPAPRPQTDLTGPLRWATGLLQCSPLPDASDTQTIGPEGGTLHVGAHTLSIPAGALDAPVTITAVAPSDNVNRIHFEPEGLAFQQSASLTMDYANCDLTGTIPLPKRIVYTTAELEILEYLRSIDNPPSHTVTGRLDHFSDYAVAW